MNADIISILCRYLSQDLGSLSCLAVAYPQWSKIVYRCLQENIKSVDLKVVSGLHSFLIVEFQNNIDSQKDYSYRKMWGY